MKTRYHGQFAPALPGMIATTNGVFHPMNAVHKEVSDIVANLFVFWHCAQQFEYFDWDNILDEWRDYQRDLGL